MRFSPLYGFRWRIYAAVSLVVSFLIALLGPDYLIASSLVRTFAVVFLVQTLLTSIYQVILYPKFLSSLRHLPHPSGGSFINGHFSTIMREPAGSPAKRWNSEIPNDGLIYYTGLYNEERILLTSTKALAEVLVQKNYDFVKPKPFTQGVGQILGIGVLLAEGEEHKSQRKNLMPAFAYRHIKDLYPLFWSKSREMVRAIARESLESEAEPPLDLSSAPVVEMASWASRATLDIIGLAGMGQDFNALQDPQNELIRAYQNIFKIDRQAMFLGLLGVALPRWLVQSLPLRRNKEFFHGIGTVRRVSGELTRQKRLNLDQEKRTGNDILSVAMESGGFTDENLVDQAMTFLGAGHETTATAMTWAVYLLCKHPDVQTRLRDEVRNGLPPIDETATPVTAAPDLDHLPFLHAVCSEVLRLVPPVRLTVREAARDTTVQGQFVPAGTRIILAPIATNTDVSLWGDDAGEFRPDRWLDTSARRPDAGRVNYAFMTFLHGPRSCIGEKFARAEFAYLLAALVGHFEMELKDKDKEVEIKGGITSRPKGGMPVRMRVVEGW